MIEKLDHRAWLYGPNADAALRIMVRVIPEKTHCFGLQTQALLREGFSFGFFLTDFKALHLTFNELSGV